MNQSQLIEALTKQLIAREFFTVLEILRLLGNDPALTNERKWLEKIILLSSQHTWLNHEDQVEVISKDEIQRGYKALTQKLNQTIQDLTKREISFAQQTLAEVDRILSDQKSTAPLTASSDGPSLAAEYEVDRMEHEMKFFTYWDTKKKQHCHFFCIHGRKAQSHGGFFQRLYYRYLEDNGEGSKGIKSQPITLGGTTDPKHSQIAFKRQLFNAFQLNPNRVGSAEKLTLARLVEEVTDVLKSPPPTLSVNIRIYTANWNESTAELLQWFWEEYCKESLLPKDSPKLYFFFSLIYPQESRKKGNWWKKRFGKRKLSSSPFQNLKQAAKQFSNFKFLPELTPVSWTDLETWATTHIIPDGNSEEIEELLEEFLPKRSTYDMASVEKELKKIIRAHNQTYPTSSPFSRYEYSENRTPQ